MGRAVGPTALPISALPSWVDLVVCSVGSRVVLLIMFHRILIGTAVVFGFGFALWEFLSYRQTGALSHLLVGVGAALLALLFAYYLKNLRRFVRY